MSAEARVNVLLIIADDHRADAIGALGHPAVKTPTLDRLVREGAHLSQARIMGGLMPAVCAPSRACLFTGRDVFRADAAPRLSFGPHYQVCLPEDACTLPERFRAEGYATFFTGKWHNDIPALLRSFEEGRGIFHGGMGPHENLPLRDLADFKRGAPARPSAGFSTDAFAGELERFLRQRDSRRPFFACLALTSPHDPRTPPPAYRRQYDAARLPLPGNFLPEHPFDNGSLEIRDEKLLPKPLAESRLREELAAYYGMISHHDAAIGRVLAALRETGGEASTVVVYLSDHGLGLGSHGLLGKQNLYEPSLRVPCLLRGPGVPSGTRCDALAYPFDLYATLCELAGISAPAGLESQSLVPALQGVGGGRAYLAALYMDQQRAITDGRWKLIGYRVSGSRREQFFDLAADPGECRDLGTAGAQESRAARLRAQLTAWQEQAGDRWWAPEPEPSSAAG